MNVVCSIQSRSLLSSTTMCTCKRKSQEKNNLLVKLYSEVNTTNMFTMDAFQKAMNPNAWVVIKNLEGV